MGGNLRSYSQLTFKTKTANNLVVNSVGGKILSVTTQKDISQPMGAFSIVLAPSIAQDLRDGSGNQLLVSDVIQAMDMVQIEFKTDDSGYKTEMIGLISRASMDTVIDPTGKPMRMFKIDGFDLGKVLQSFKMYFNPYLTTRTGQEFGGYVYFGNNSTLFKDKNPATFIQTFLSFVFGKSTNTGPIYPFKIGDKTVPAYIDLFSGVSTQFTSHSMTDPFILLGIEAGQEVSVWDIVKAYSDPPFHEVFVDLRRPTNPTDLNSIQTATQTHRLAPLNSSTPAKVSSALAANTTSPTTEVISNNNLVFQQPYVVYMRTSPFDQESWNNLNTHEFFQTDIIQQDTSTSEDNIFNYYEVWCERENFFMGNIQISNLAQNTANKIPIFDNDSIQTFGLRRFPQNSTKYVEFIKSTDANNLSIWQKQAILTREIFRWFAYGQLLESGSITVKGRVGVDKGGITMGSRFVELNAQGVATGKEFYIEGVTQMYNLGQPLRTSLTVTRGHRPRDRFALVDKLEKALNLRGREFGD